MTMADVDILTTYWLEHPPTHLLLGGRRMKMGHQNDLLRLLGGDPDATGPQRMMLN